MEQLRGYSVRVERIPIAGRTYELLMPADSDGLLDDPRVAARFDQDEYLPYWAAIWPAALLLGNAVAGWGAPPAGTEPPRVLELGGGLGLVGLVAASLGYRVTISDYDEDALAFAEANAGRNGVGGLDFRRIDWRREYEGLRPDRILAADVLYESRNLEPIARFVARHLNQGGVAWIADANRSTADPFEHVARGCGLGVTVMPVEAAEGAGGGVPAGRIFVCRVEA